MALVRRAGRGRIWARALPVIAVLVMGAVSSLAAPAQAAIIHPLLFQEKLPEDETPLGVAVSQATHHFYVASFGINGNTSRIINFEANGQIDPVSPELIGDPSFAPFLVAVDNSGGALTNYIYASDRPDAVQQFDPSGKATAVTITEAAIPPNGTPQGGGLPPVVNNGGFSPREMTVDGSGSVLVTDDESHAIYKFTSAGAFVAQLAAGKIFTSCTKGIASDAAGNVYLANECGPLGAGLVELNAAGECVALACTPIDPAQIRGVAIDESRGRIFTTGSIGAEAAEEGKFSEYDATTHELLGVTHPAQSRFPYGIGVDEATGEVIITDLKPTQEGTIQIYGPAEEVPDVKTLAPETPGVETVTLRGEIGAAGISGATCAFQYIDDEEFEAHGFEGAAEAKCTEGPFSGTEMHVVKVNVKGLRGGTTYHERLVGSNANGSNGAEDISFTTLGPTITGSQAREVTQNSVTLAGIVDPNGSATSYRFQYLTQAQFDEEGQSWTEATEIPLGGETIGAGSAGVEVSQHLEGLSSGTAYRFRLLAVSGEGETKGEEVSFSTFALTGEGLPDSRRYEQATPIDKNGANVQGGINSVQASLDGNGVTFFANTGIPGGEGSQQFPTYLSSRAADWSTQGLLPPASYGPGAAVLGWSEDLRDTYDFATLPFEPGKLLRRANVGGGLSQLGTVGAAGNPFAFAGSAQGGAVALVETKAGGLLPGKDLAGKQNLYAYGRDTGNLVVAGVLNPTTPGGEPLVPPGGAMAGSYDWFRGKSTSGLGGAFGVYFTQAQHAISSDGSRVFFTAGESGQLYVRENPLAPQSAMSGELCTEPAKACTIRISAPEEGVVDPKTPVAFVGAGSDGRLVYFLDKGKLTKDATGGAGYDLYRYDLESGKLTDLTLDVGDKAGARVEGVLGISDSGEQAYFVAAGALSGETKQAPSGETNLYALAGAELHFIGRLGTVEEAEQLNWAPSSKTGSGGTGTIVAHTSRLSADGQTLLFRSTRQLTSYRNHEIPELYLYRSGAGLSCVSCNPSGQAPAGPAGVQEIPVVGIHLTRNYAFMTRNLSADGRRVIFDSADQLLSADQNNVNDVYEWEADGKGSCGEEAVAGGCLFLISSGAKEAGPSYFGDADREGDNAFFFTSQPLVAQDKDELVDLYDARVGGGIAGQEAAPVIPCNGEVCANAGGGEPPTAAPTSPGANGENVVPRPSCKKGFVRRHGKCVPRHKKKAHNGKHKRRHARANAGGGR